MIITKYFTPYSKSFSINLREIGLGAIEISSQMALEGEKWETPNVNWAGCGSQSAEKTIDFAMALVVAGAIAALLPNIKDQQDIFNLKATILETCDGAVTEKDFKF